LVQKFSKSANICKSYCKKFTGTFFMDHGADKLADWQSSNFDRQATGWTLTVMRVCYHALDAY